MNIHHLETGKQRPTSNAQRLFLELKPRLDLCNGCSECWLRCEDGVQASREEWNAIADYLEKAVGETRLRIENAEAQNKAVDLGDDVSVTMCRFFDREEKNCTIYPVRPLVCRLLGHVEWLPCPIEKVSPVPTEPALFLLRRYAEEERKTFAEWELHREKPRQQRP